MAAQNSKKARRNPHAGRPRGYAQKTGRRAGPKIDPPLSEVEKVNLGAGMFRTFAPIGAVR